MPIVLHYPNEVMGLQYCDKYSDFFDAAPVASGPVQFPANFAIAHPELMVYICNGHRGPAAVQYFVYSSSPSSLSSSSSSSLPLVAPPPSPVGTSPPSPVVAISRHALSHLASPSDSSYSSLFSGSASSPPSISLIPSQLQRALIPTFSPHNGFYALDSVVGDPTLRSLLHHRLATQLAHHIPSAEDVQIDVSMGEHSYSIRPGIRHMMWESLDSVGDYLLCSANNHNPFCQGSRPDIPIFIETANLAQLGLPMPGASLFRVYALQARHHIFPDIDSAIDFVHMVKSVYHYFINWIANAIRISIEFGYHCSWNWGAAVGMSKVETIHRITRYFFYGNYLSLERFMSHQLLRNEMDFACARIISGAFNLRILSITRGECTYLAHWPLSYQSNDAGDLFVRTHLQELGCSVSTLNQIIMDNEPGD
ncbi:hypothetical protein C8J57DRAFT_1472762 [Mycena rebaudengoi]|nr:hypothetical protein C8J57DRAFT_1472762 [Mycena rebaudengoi]